MILVKFGRGECNSCIYYFNNFTKIFIYYFISYICLGLFLVILPLPVCVGELCVCVCGGGLRWGGFSLRLRVSVKDCWNMSAGRVCGSRSHAKSRKTLFHELILNMVSVVHVGMLLGVFFSG